MRRRGKEVSTDVPLTSRDMGELALIAMLRDLSIAELRGQVLAGAIKKDMIKKNIAGRRPPGDEKLSRIVVNVLVKATPGNGKVPLFK